MNITLLTLTTSSGAPAGIRLESGQSLLHRPAQRGKSASILACEWMEGQGFRVAIHRGHNVKTGRLSLYF